VKSSAKAARQLAAIHRLRGCMKRKAGDKTFAEWWAEYKREEKELEESKYERWLRSNLTNLGFDARIIRPR
jgi:hypothetical protein